jgi:hypothetical protein
MFKAESDSSKLADKVVQELKERNDKAREQAKKALGK